MFSSDCMSVLDPVKVNYFFHQEYLFSWRLVAFEYFINLVYVKHTALEICLLICNTYDLDFVGLLLLLLFEGYYLLE